MHPAAQRFPRVRGIEGVLHPQKQLHTLRAAVGNTGHRVFFAGWCLEMRRLRHVLEGNKARLKQEPTFLKPKLRDGL